ERLLREADYASLSAHLQEACLDNYTRADGRHETHQTQFGLTVQLAALRVARIMNANGVIHFQP
ncbi:MAG TPA: hypothetical protein PKC99_10910, partial [Anaerolineales bacterium]|nr:hypothetical protein [Anaerolineales bacterium]